MTNELMLFSADQVCRLTGLKKGRLAYWHSTKFYQAEHVGDAGQPYGRVYSFLDLVALRTIALLVNSHRIYLGELRKVAENLSDRRGDWAGCKFLVGGKKVYWIPARGSEDDIHGAHPPEQIEMRVGMDEVVKDVRATLAKAQERGPEDIGQIVRHRNVASNAYVLSGTRIPTGAVWAFHEEGHDASAIQRQYPRLTVKDIEAAIQFERRHRAAS